VTVVVTVVPAGLGRREVLGQGDQFFIEEGTDNAGVLIDVAAIGQPIRVGIFLGALLGNLGDDDSGVTVEDVGEGAVLVLVEAGHVIFFLFLKGSGVHKQAKEACGCETCH